MTIKKPMKAPAPEPVETPAAAPAATIADRFKLDVPDPAAVKKSSGGGAGAMIALVAALLALAVSGVLTFIIYQHWEFLKAA